MKTYYIYGKLSENPSCPMFHIQPTINDTAPKDYYPLAIIKGETLLQALLLQLDKFNIPTKTQSKLVFEHRPFNQLTFLQQEQNK